MKFSFLRRAKLREIGHFQLASKLQSNISHTTLKKTSVWEPRPDGMSHVSSALDFETPQQCSKCNKRLAADFVSHY
jgi:hypothetical protein